MSQSLSFCLYARTRNKKLYQTVTSWGTLTQDSSSASCFFSEYGPVTETKGLILSIGCYQVTTSKDTLWVPETLKWRLSQVIGFASWASPPRKWQEGRVWRISVFQALGGMKKEKEAELIEFKLDVHYSYSESSCKVEWKSRLRVLHNEVWILLNDNLPSLICI